MSLKHCALAALVGGSLSTAAFADTSETKGGFSIKTDDGRFAMSIGGRIHVDANVLQPDDDASFGSNKTTDRSAFFFRRVYLTFKGTAYGWNWKIEPDFCGSGGTTFTPTTTVVGTTTVLSGGTAADQSNTCREFNFQDIYLSTTVGPGELFIGQRKRFVGLEELTSSNELTLQERPYTTASGLFAGVKGAGARDFQTGVFYLAQFTDHATLGVDTYSLDNARASTDPTAGTTRGYGWNLRGTYAPLIDDGMVVHLGATYSSDKLEGGALGAAVRYADRLGPSQTLGVSTDGARTWTFEAATAIGPFYAQTEYGSENLMQGASPVDPGTVKAWELMASFFVTGETKPYDKKNALFKSPKPNQSWGAIEAVAGYEQARNNDNPGQCSSTATECKVSDITVGANWYVNPDVRFMLNYVIGKDDLGAAGQDKPKAITARAQFNL
jgi:phosphate-selective porin OprO/OprP